MTASGHDRVLSPGTATGELLVLDAPVSFWGGVDSDGYIVEHRHPQYGTRLTGRVVAMTSGKGSSSSSSVLAELIRSKAAPAAILLESPDLILALGALAAGELYDRWMPVVVIRGPISPGRLRVHAPRQGNPSVQGAAAATAAQQSSERPHQTDQAR